MVLVGNKKIGASGSANNGAGARSGGRPLENVVVYQSNVTLGPAAVPFSYLSQGYAGYSMLTYKHFINLTLTNTNTAATDVSLPPLEVLIQSVSLSGKSSGNLSDTFLGAELDFAINATLLDPRLVAQNDMAQSVTVPASGSLSVPLTIRENFAIDAEDFGVSLSGFYAPTSVLGSLPSGVSVSGFSHTITGTFVPGRILRPRYCAMRNIPITSAGDFQASNSLINREVDISAYGISDSNGDSVGKVLTSLDFSSDGVTFQLPSTTPAQIAAELQARYPYTNSIGEYAVNNFNGPAPFNKLLPLPVAPFSQRAGVTKLDFNLSAVPYTPGGTANNIRAFVIGQA